MLFRKTPRLSFGLRALLDAVKNEAFLSPDIAISLNGADPVSNIFCVDEFHRFIIVFRVPLNLSYRLYRSFERNSARRRVQS